MLPEYGNTLSFSLCPSDSLNPPIISERSAKSYFFISAPLSCSFLSKTFISFPTGKDAIVRREETWCGAENAGAPTKGALYEKISMPIGMENFCIYIYTYIYIQNVFFIKKFVMRSGGYWSVRAFITSYKSICQVAKSSVFCGHSAIQYSLNNSAIINKGKYLISISRVT